MSNEHSLNENKESEFHDQWASQAINEQLYIDEAFESESAPENRQILRWMGNLKGKKILELGCGLGESSIYFASKGAIVTATDISAGMLKVVQKNAIERNLKIETIQVSANHLNNISDDTYDFIYAANLLHHVDISKCVTELKKKLKVNGSAYFWDPVDYNPAINVYRRIATKVRTEDEHPLKTKDLKEIERVFGQPIETQFFWLTGLYVFFKYYFIDRVDPNKERYWKKILADSSQLSSLLRVLHKIDYWLFKIVPGLKFFAWNVAIKATKK
jgi:2-polyprenyl-3-methyl-5-hydroxy-6-metoxy-1,4-benzoquinol methylase